MHFRKNSKPTSSNRDTETVHTLEYEPLSIKTNTSYSGTTVSASIPINHNGPSASSPSSSRPSPLRDSITTIQDSSSNNIPYDEVDPSTWNRVTLSIADSSRKPSLTFSNPPSLSDSGHSTPLHSPTKPSPASEGDNNDYVILPTFPSAPATRSSSQTRSPWSSRLDSPRSWLVLYFAFNLGLTLFNKLVLQGFPFPWTLTAVHSFSGVIGSLAVKRLGFFTPAKLSQKENLIMIAFSSLYTVNIAVSNLSLHQVSVPLHQCIRALSPLITIAISLSLFKKRPTFGTLLSLLPVVFGVIFATYGEYEYKPGGLVLTFLGAVLASVKGIVTNRVQVGRLKLHPLDVLYRMSPLALLQCLLWGYCAGELDKVQLYTTTEMASSKLVALCVNGCIAFGLNVVSFTANKKTGALTMTVAANVKQVLTIVLAVFIFHIDLNFTKLLGIVLTLAGGAWYAKVQMAEKARSSNGNPLPSHGAGPAEVVEKTLIA
ncbi:TPT-domain-containing protein, partial [Meredithblackwellia eburnea MCA 4105]